MQKSLVIFILVTVVSASIALIIPPCQQCKDPYEEWRRCGTAVQRTCATRDQPAPTSNRCYEGCFCKEGYIRKTANGECIKECTCPIRRCPPPTDCPPPVVTPTTACSSTTGGPTSTTCSPETTSSPAGTTTSTSSPETTTTPSGTTTEGPTTSSPSTSTASAPPLPEESPIVEAPPPPPPTHSHGPPHAPYP